MTDHTVTHVSLEDYLAHYAADFYEYYKGEIIDLSPVKRQQEFLTFYFRMLLQLFLERTALGQAFAAPFMMRLADDIRREPDIMVVLNDNQLVLTDSGLIGPADICVEIVSLESTERDYGVKLREYEAHGVREYWIIDPLRHVATFWRLDATSAVYDEVVPADGIYNTPLLPQFALHVEDCFREPQMTGSDIVAAVQGMFNGD